MGFDRLFSQIIPPLGLCTGSGCARRKIRTMRFKMDFFQVILERESVRNYDPGRPVDGKVLDRILEAGRNAPSACNQQPWKFLVVSSPGLLAKVHGCYSRDWFSGSPHVLIVKGDRNAAWVRESDAYNSLETDLAIAMDHMILAAENEGVSTCWVEAFNPARLREVLELKPTEFVFAMTPLGYPKAGFEKKGASRKTRKALGEIAEFL